MLFMYLASKIKCSPNKLDWSYLLEKLKKESVTDKDDMERVEKIYKYYVKRGSLGYILLLDD